MIARMGDLRIADCAWNSACEKRQSQACTKIGRRWPTATNRISYKTAGCWSERESAFRMVYDAYLKSGLISCNPMKMRVTRYHLSPSTAVFLAMRRRELIYTMSLVVDDPAYGLPLESLYADEVAEMRDRGYRLAEVSCLAGTCEDTADRREMFDVFVGLTGFMFQYARYNGVDRLLVAVHPRHAKFYRHFYGFEVFGELKSYDAVHGNPAVGCYHDFEETDFSGYRLRNQVYAERYEPWELETPTRSELETFQLECAVDMATEEMVPLAA